MDTALALAAPQAPPAPIPDAAEIITSTFGGGSADAPAAPTTPETPKFDPASVVIPQEADLPPHFQKFKGKTLADVIGLDLQTQQWATTKAQEAATAKREAEDLRARLAAAEQIAKMTPQKAPEAPADPFAGIDIEHELFRDPKKVVTMLREQLRTELREEQKVAARAEAERVGGEIGGRINSERAAAMQIATFDTAKDQLKAAGIEFPKHDDYVAMLGFVMPTIAQQAKAEGNPQALYEPERIVNAIRFLRGSAPPVVATVPNEAAPPIPARTAQVMVKQPNVPTVSREHRQLYEQIGKGLGFEGPALENYIQATATSTWKPGQRRERDE